MRVVSEQDVVRSARWTFWAFLGAVALMATLNSVPSLPNALLWMASTVVVAGGVAFVRVIVRMPQGPRTLWSLIGAWGLLVALLSLTV